MIIRQPAVAGSFYPAEPAACRQQVKEFTESAQKRPAVERRIVGGVVPHAGWICSGAVAAGVIEQIGLQRNPAVAVIFGAVHVPLAGEHGWLFPFGAWRSPLGDIPVDERIGKRVCDRTVLIDSAPSAHDREHSIEVEVPFIQHMLPQAAIVPIMVPVVESAAALGAAVGQACRDFGVDAVFLASTDLTHYGPSYGFMPEGVGSEGLRWAKEVNDRRMIDLMLAMREHDVVREAIANRNACGPGAVAATIAACKAYGATGAMLLEHTTSYEVLRGRFGEPPRDAVGYSGLVFHE